MRDLAARFEDALAIVERAAASPTESPASGIDTLALLHRLADRLRAPRRSEDEADVHALCRRLGVAGVVYDRYRDGWRRPEQPTALDAPSIALLAAVLTGWAIGAVDADAAARGLALKTLNGALTALDLARANGADVVALDAITREALGSFT